MIILFDGICVFCDSFIKFIVKRDKKNIFRLCFLQSDAARVLALENKISFDQKNLQSLILLKNGKVFYKTAAAIEILSELGGAWPAVRLFLIVPRKIRDFFYDFFGRNRYKWFGKKECLLDEGIRGRIIK